MSCIVKRKIVHDKTAFYYGNKIKERKDTDEAKIYASLCNLCIFSIRMKEIFKKLFKA